MTPELLGMRRTARRRRVYAVVFVRNCVLYAAVNLTIFVLNTITAGINAWCLYLERKRDVSADRV